MPLGSDLTGKQFSEWKVLKFSGLDKNRNSLWSCECSCGYQKDLPRHYLITGGSSKCQNCSRKPKKYKEELPQSVWDIICRRATKKGIEFSITKDHAYKLYLNQNRKCALSGLLINFPENGTSLRWGEATASLDRIDSSKGYKPDNIQWVHKHINRMKNIFNEQYFIDMCYYVSENQKLK
jgi:hypothetical protein